MSQTLYRFDECAFKLTEEYADETAETITAAFDDWWLYGSSEDGDGVVTVEERVAILEDLILGEE